MIFPNPRLLYSALFLLALLGAPLAHSQSSAVSSSIFKVTLTPLLPDAPSFSTSQQAAQAPAQIATDPCKKTSAALPGETEEQHRTRDERAEAACDVKAEEKQRIGGVMPDFNVVMAGGSAVPLTKKQKFDLSFHTIIDPYTVGLAVIVGGGFGELNDDHTGYGHGPAGFFKRVGASYADNVDGNFIGNALLPVILHQDPRYFRKGSGSVKSRIIYSALTTFICHGDNGKRQFNVSNVAGNFIAGAISNAYYPADERGVGLTIDNGLVVTLEGMIGAQLLEFSPDVTDKIKRHHQRKLAEKAAKAAGQQNSSTQPPVIVQPGAPRQL